MGPFPQLPRVFEPPTIDLERLVFPGFDAGTRDLFELEAKKVGPAGQFAGSRLSLLEGVPGRRPAAVECTHLDRRLLESREGVQNRPLGPSIEQRLVLVLTMEIDQRRPQPTDHAGRRGGAVDPGPVAPLCLDLAPQDQETVLGLESQFIELSEERGVTLDVEHPLHDRSIGADSHVVRRGPLTEQQRQGSHDDRLSGAGFAGEGVESGSELEAQSLYDGVVANAELDEHRRS